MAFDKELDKELFGEEVSFDGTKIRVSVFSYNEGQPKIQLSRTNYSEATDDYVFSKLGRMTVSEAKAVYPLIEKALASIESN